MPHAVSYRKASILCLFLFCLLVVLVELSLSYFEQIVSDPEIMVAFPVVGDPDNAAFVAWTTTPWTLPSNLALCVNANFTYVKVGDVMLIIAISSFTKKKKSNILFFFDTNNLRIAN